MTYAVKEIFGTLQGEGFHAGTPSVFVRFAGCNLWTGRSSHRSRDARRHDAVCPEWCDTDFAKGKKYDAGLLADTIVEAAIQAGIQYIPHIVFTGGEPLMQLDAELLRVVLDRVQAENGEGLHGCPRIAVETNGTIVPDPDTSLLIDWVCVSPKQAPHRIRLRGGSELKVVWPGGMVEPNAYRSELGEFEHYFISPLAEVHDVGRSIVVRESMQTAARYVLENPGWKLTLQQHKVIGLP